MTLNSTPAPAQVQPSFVTFVVIWFGQVISIFGTGLTGFALGVWVFQKTGSATQFSLISMSGLLPSILLSPLAGVLVDRWDRRHVLIVGNLIAAVTTLGVATLIYFGRLELWHIYLSTLINATCGTFFTPAFMSSVTLLVSPQQYGRASGMSQLGAAAAPILAPLVAGMLVVSIGIWGVMVIDFATFIVALVTLLMVSIPRPPAAAANVAGQGHLLQEAIYGLKYLLSRSGLLVLLIFMALANFALGIVQVLLTPLVLSFSDAIVLGRILTLSGVGTVLGGLVMSLWGGPKRRIYGILGFTLLQGVLLFLGGVRPNAFLIVIAASVFVFSAQIVTGCSQAIWQSKVNPEVQGRVLSFRIMVASLSTALAYLAAGPLADYVFEPLLAVGGQLSGTLGQLTGVGPGRGIGFLYILLGLAIVVMVLLGTAYPRLRQLELELPDAVVANVSAPTAES